MTVQPILKTSEQEAPLNNLKGQAFVEQVCQEALRTVRINHEHHTNYIDVDLKNQANMEASTMGAYHGRYIFELLQNANDAALLENGVVSTPKSLKRVRIELTDDSLLVANDGTPFQEKDVDSIYRWGESSKDPNKSIGYKGIGFKSVLEITDSPQIFSETVQFHFDRRKCYKEVENIVGKIKGLKLPFTRFVFPFSLGEVESPDRELVEQLLINEGFATVIRLPLLPRVNQDDVLRQIEQDVDPALLLFLNGIDRIEIWVHGKRIYLYSRKQNRRSGLNGQEITLYQSGKVISRWLLFNAPKCEIKDRNLVNDLQREIDAWRRVSKVGFSIAFPLDDKGKILIETENVSPLYVYFPTNLPSGMGYRIHGDFYVTADRKSIETRPYNQWLAHQIALYMSKTVIPELVKRFPDDERVLEILVPISDPLDFSLELYQAICDQLADSSFVLTTQGDYSIPKSILILPKGVWEDMELFFRYFPDFVLSKLNQNKKFLSGKLYQNENNVDFLLKLGARQLEFSNVFLLLDGESPVNQTKEYSEFYNFLWKWRERLEYWEDQQFSSALQNYHCIVNSQGIWIKPHDQLYHAKLRQETPSMPSCLKADLVHPDAYDEEGRSGATYQLLNTFTPKVKDYDAPAIIRNAIIPLFESHKFHRLSTAERTEIYLYLFDYWRNRRGGDPEVDQIVSRVEVYARLIANRRQMEWLPVNEVYLSNMWTGNNLLEEVYDGFEDIAFLYDIRGLDLTQEEYYEWGKFWVWLGVNRVPRILIHEHNYYSWNSVNSHIPHSGTKLWDEYSDEIRERFGRCPQHGADARVIQRSVTLEGFAQLIENQDVGRLMAFFQLLAENWSSVNTATLERGRLQCQRGGYCRVANKTVQVPSFFDYLLKKTKWVPARSNVNGKVNAVLQSPTRCWFVSASEDAIIRNMLSTPLIDFDTTNPAYRQFCRDIGMRFMDEAKLDDLVDILKTLPEQYPDPNLSVSTGKRAIPRAVSTLTRWVIGRIYNLLTQADSKIPPIIDSIPLAASRGEELHYINPPEPIFFADDRYHSPRWKDHLPFAPLDENWRDAAEYLRIKLLSHYVEELVVPGNILEEETNRLMSRYKQARPYMLSVVNNQRTSSIEDVVRFLSNLEIQVVESLVVNRHLTIGDGKIIPDNDARIFLEERLQERAGSAGRAPRAGILYIRKGFENNYDLMGTPIADYVRIPGLSDAFVILLDRGGKDGRMKYLDTRDITESDVETMRTILSQTGLIDEQEEEIVDSARDLNNHLIKRLERDNQDQNINGEHGGLSPENVFEKLATEGDQESDPEDETNQEEETTVSDESIEFPAIVFEDINPIQVVAFKPMEPLGLGKSGGGQGRGGGILNWERDHRLREAYGERGEVLVYELELKRLKKLGVERPEEIVCWLRKVGRSTADHDIESKDLIDSEWVNIVIEVKATPGRDFRFEMSKGELFCAQQYGTRYQLHRVIDVSSATPVDYIYENPYYLWQRGLAVIEPRDTYVILPDPKLLNDNN